MNEIVSSLEDITNEAKTIYNRMEKDYARWGELMLEAKKLVPRGHWLKYLEEHFPMVGQRQANRYMELAKDETKTLTQISNRTRLANQSLKSNLHAMIPEETRVLVQSDYVVDKVYKEHLREFKQRGQVMVMHIREFLTIENTVGRDLKEALDNIDKFESQEELALLKEMQIHCERLAIRAAETAKKLKQALGTKEKTI